MAILPITPGITAQVIIVKERAAEYGYDKEQVIARKNHERATYLQEHTVKKYIQSEEDDKMFSVKLTVGPPYIRGTYMVDTRLTFYVYFDGMQIATASVLRKGFRSRDVGTMWEHTIDGVISIENGVKKLKKFKFSPLFIKPVEGDGSSPSATLTEELSRIGTIKIEVFGETAGKQKFSDKKFKNPKRPGGGQVPETAMKGEAKIHSITFGEATTTKKNSQIVIAKRTSEDFPLAIFEFLYRDNTCLRQLKVLPSTAMPTTPQRPINNAQSAATEPVSRTAAHANPAPGPLTDSVALFVMFQKFHETYFAPGAGSTASPSVPLHDGGKEEHILVKRERLAQERDEARAAKKARLANGEEESVTIDLTGDD